MVFGICVFRVNSLVKKFVDGWVHVVDASLRRVSL